MESAVVDTDSSSEEEPPKTGEESYKETIQRDDDKGLESITEVDLDAEDYKYSFNMIGAKGNIVIENLRGNNAHVFNQQSKGQITNAWILLDSCSTGTVRS